jgi:hypothetical protein
MFRALLLLAAMAVVNAAAAASKSPNIVLIMTDDQGFGEFSTHGNPITDTAHIDRLARQGISLTDFHVAPMCTPTRGQLLSGLDAFRNGAINVANDLHQDHDVAAQHPEIVAKMRSHLNRWWDEFKDTVMEPQRVIIGSPKENPATLSACEWLDVFVDQQVQIRRGVKKNGVWHLNVAQAGDYTFKLRRFPEESGKALRESVPQAQVTDGSYPGGPGFDIHLARLRIGTQVFEEAVASQDQHIAFKATLPAGDTTLQTWFLGADGKELLGANFVTVERLD